VGSKLATLRCPAERACFIAWLGEPSLQAMSPHSAHRLSRKPAAAGQALPRNVSPLVELRLRLVSVKKRTPLTGHLSLGSRNGLALGVPPWRRKVLTIGHVLSFVIVEPSLPGFKTGGNGVTCFAKVLRGVLTG